MKLLVAGAGGFIGQALATSNACSMLHHDDDPPRSAPDVLIYAGRDPALGGPLYDLESDAELIWARYAHQTGCRFLHLGSRKVYAPTAEPLVETSAIGPVDPYGLHKWAMEVRLRDLLGDHLSVVRIANAFGYERGRRSFFGAMLDRLALEGRIVFDMNRDVKRDFVPVDFVAQAILAVSRHSDAVTLNVGSGIGLATGMLADAVIDGFGSGELVIDDDRHHDAFVLDVSYLRQLTGLVVHRDEILQHARELGRRLRDDR